LVGGGPGEDKVLPRLMGGVGITIRQVKDMLEVVFSDSEKGSMKLAKVYDKAGMRKSAASIGYIGEGAKIKPTRGQLDKMLEGKAVGGSSQDVVGIGCNLDIGDISGDIYGEKRRSEFIRIFGPAMFPEEEMEDFFRHQMDDFEKLMAAAKEGAGIRAWVSHAPHSACGFAFLCFALAQIDCPLSVVFLPECRQDSPNSVSCFSGWGEVSPGKFHSFLHLEREIHWTEKLFYAGSWQGLAAENAPLRAVVNGRLISVPENFYDHIILMHIPEGEFAMSRLIGDIMAKNPMGVSYHLYVLRINEMIAQGILALVAQGDPDHPHGKILKKKETS
jgi:hypothetical protein